MREQMRFDLLGLKALAICMAICWGATPASAVPLITDDEKETAIAPIKLYSEVIDAAIIQQDSKVELVLLVIGRTNPYTARELGEIFLRLVKRVTRDIDPDQYMGRGMYDYTVRVVYPDDVDVAIGKKNSSSERLYWLDVKDPTMHLHDTENTEQAPDYIFEGD